MRILLSALLNEHASFLPQPLYDPLTLATISAVATAAGTGVSAMGTLAAGKSQQQAARFQAKQLDIKANEELAAGQREGEQYERKKDLALSTLQNRAAGSGFSATDPTALILGDDIEKWGTVQQDMATYGGLSRKAGAEAQADAARFEGKAARQASYWKAASTIAGGVSTMADRYGGRRPPTSSTGSSGYWYG